jgi:hypothetical protein
MATRTTVVSDSDSLYDIESWLYRIATSASTCCGAGAAGPIPIDFDGLEVLPHAQDLEAAADPADAVATREDVELALFGALQACPPVSGRCSSCGKCCACRAPK